MVDLVITDRARFEVDRPAARLLLTTPAPGETIDGVRAITLAPVAVALR